jgi:hypothetical protein
MATQPQVTAGGPRQRLLLVAALAAVLALALGLLVLRPLLAGRTEEVATPPQVTAGTAPATTPQLIGPSTTLAASGEAAGSVKDPFRPLVSAGTAAATAEAGVTPADGGTAGATPTTIAATQPTVPGAGAGTATAPGGGATAERKVTLVNVANGAAKVSVDGTSYRVEEGERFAGDYRVVDIGHACATLESGTTPFTLCEGEAVLK